MVIINVLLWLVVLYIVSYLFLPVTKRMGLIGLSKVFGLVSLTYIVWITSFFTNFSFASVLGFLIYLTTCSILWIVEARRLAFRFKETLLEFFGFETIFLIFFLLYVIYELFNPYAFGAEKMTDMAILTSITKSKGMPPYDPFLAGYRFDCYYYMGYVIYAVLTVLSLSSTHVSYNLACATVFALTITSLSQLVLKFKRKVLVPFLLLSGNLVTFKMLLMGNLRKAFDFWTVTRVIKGTINEFPLATLFFRDLHPHFISIPLQVSFLVSLFFWVREDRKSIACFLIFLLGFMFTVNSWDFFTYGFILLLTALIYRRFYVFLLTPILTAFLPFYLGLHASAVKGIGFVVNRSDLISFLLAQPLVLLPIAYSLIEDRKLFAISLTAVAPVAYTLKFPVLILTFPPLVVVCRKLLKEKSFEHCLILSALLILTAVEVVYVNDAYGGEIERLNTVFKTYVQAWILLSLGFVPRREGIYKAFTLALIAVLWIYPVGCLVGLPTLGYKGTLDSIEFTKNYGEYKALKFLYRFDGVVVEYPGKSPYESYTYSGRVSAYTGLRSVLSNGGHEYFWRFFDKDIVKVLNERFRDVRSIYESKELNYTILKRYNVTFIYIGYLEKRNYNVSYGKFSKLKKVYDDGNVVIYKVIYPK